MDRSIHPIKADSIYFSVDEVKLSTIEKGEQGVPLFPKKEKNNQPRCRSVSSMMPVTQEALHISHAQPCQRVDAEAPAAVAATLRGAERREPAPVHRPACSWALPLRQQLAFVPSLLQGMKLLGEERDSGMS